MNSTWSIIGVCRVDYDGETTYDFERNGVKYREIGGAEHLDPPNLQSQTRPKYRMTEAELSDFLSTELSD